MQCGTIVTYVAGNCSPKHKNPQVLRDNLNTKIAKHSKNAKLSALGLMCLHAQTFITARLVVLRDKSGTLRDLPLLRGLYVKIPIGSRR